MPRPATSGPAYLNLDDGVAHARQDCAGYLDARVSAEANTGPMHGFVWCGECAGSLADLERLAQAHEREARRLLRDLTVPPPEDGLRRTGAGGAVFE